jgi:hypothetical protein
MDKYLRLALARNIERWAPPKGTDKRTEFFFTMSAHKSLNLEILKMYRDENWAPDQLIKNQNFDWSWVDTFRGWKWNWRRLGECCPPIEFILQNLDKPWDWYILTVADGVTFSDMVKYHNLPWAIEELMFQEISEPSDIEFLRFYKHRYDEAAWIDHSRRVRWKLAKTCPDLPWQYELIKPDIKDQTDIKVLEDIRENVDWPSLSKTVDTKLILANKHLPWFWNTVSMNPTLTFEQVVDNPDIKWFYSRVPDETFTHRLARKWMACFKIQRSWKRSVSNPEYSICRNRLLKEWGEFEINVAEQCTLGHPAINEGYCH